MKRIWSVPWIALLLAACMGTDSPVEQPPGDDPPGERLDNNAFGNIQPHHVYDSAYHAAIQAYGPNAVLVCNASLPEGPLLDDLRSLVGPDAVLLANDNSTFVPLWGEQSAFWDAYRAAMNPRNVGLPDSAWYWLDASGERRLAPKPCWTGWCGEFWPGWALKPDTSAYRAKAEFLAANVGDFDGIWLDEWHEGFDAYQVEGLGLPPERVNGLSQQWIVCRRFYVDLLRELLGPDFRLVPNLQPARHTDYPQHEMVRFDGHTTEFPDAIDLARFQTYPSDLNVGWTGDLDVVGVVRKGYGLPANLDP